MNNPTRRRQIESAFVDSFGRRPRFWTRAPGRVDLMGSHTDYNEGFVLTLPIDRDTWIAAAPRADGMVAARSLNLDSSLEIDLREPLAGRAGGWEMYVRGVVVMLQRAGHDVPGFDAVIHGTVPVASGLSSSASLEAAMAVLCECLGRFKIDRPDLARLCQQAENEVVGVQCGILDQFSSLLGRQDNALLLDCRNLAVRQVPLPPDLAIVICNTRAPRELSGSEYGTRRAHCEDGVRGLRRRLPGINRLRDVSLSDFLEHQHELQPTVARRCRFIIEESQRVLDMEEALRANDRSLINAVCTASFAGARDLFEITVPLMEAMHDAMIGAPGTVGARQAGAGFGGCLVAVVRRGKVPAFTEYVEHAYEAETRIRPEVYSVEVAPGAGVLE